jgi:hypothetical protein
MAGVNQIIYGSDYNAVQTKVRQVLGDGYPNYGDYGYGVSLTSSPVSSTATIYGADWNNLIADVKTAYVHVNGANYSGYTSSVSGNISYANLNNANVAIDSALASRTSVNAGQITQTSAYSRSFTSAWSSSISSDVTFTFASATAARYFFNAGGTLLFQGTYAYGSATAQNDAWSQLMTDFSYTINRAEWYALQTSGNGYVPYTLSNDVNVGAVYRVNTVNVTSAVVTSTAIQFTVAYNDSHVGTGGGPDSVDGTIGFRVYQNNPNFSSYNPSYAHAGSGY